MSLGEIFLLSSHKSYHVLNFYSIFTMKAVAKLRDHNFERENPTKRRKFPLHSKEIFPFHLAKHPRFKVNSNTDSNDFGKTNNCDEIAMK